MLGTTATAYVFTFCGRNPKIIVRWPLHVTTTRRNNTGTTGNQDPEG
jgi:hypothetical protein